MKKTQYGGYVVMFLPNKIIKNKNLNYSQKNVGLAHGFKTMCMVLNLCAHGFKTMCTWYVHGFKTMCKTF